MHVKCFKYTVRSLYVSKDRYVYVKCLEYTVRSLYVSKDRYM